MMPRLLMLALWAVAMVPGLALAQVEAGKMRFVVSDQVLHEIDARMFGQFMERASWAGETGAEAGLVPGTHQLQPDVVRLLREMAVPIIRFPGGTDVDFLDWRDMIDNVPGRGAARPMSKGHTGGPITNNFGYDEFLRLAEDLGSEVILVVNLRDALFKVKPLEEAARDAASLVAYCNAPVGARLPTGIADWPAVRSRNGRPEPYGVKYFQIGNETWAFIRKMEEADGAGVREFYMECVAAYVDAMRAVDPSIQIIMDGHPDWIVGMARERLGDKVHYMVVHEYRPWGIREVKRGDATVPARELTDEAIWYAWVATPAIDERGRSVFQRPMIQTAREHGYKVAITEWNWNGGWWGHPRPQPGLDSSFAKGVGAAGFLHALMRNGHTVQIGCQSMLVGKGWGITAIHADPEGKSPPFFMPSGQVTALYSQHHGDRMLAMREENVPTYAQPYRMGSIRPAARVAYVDALATRSDGAVFFHAINRRFDDGSRVTIDVSACGEPTGQAVLHVLEGRLNNAPGPGEPVQIGQVRHEPITFEGGTLEVTLPRRSVSCIEVALRPDGG